MHFHKVWRGIKETERIESESTGTINFKLIEKKKKSWER